MSEVDPNPGAGGEQQGGESQGGEFYSGIQDEAVRGWAENKGIQSTEAALKSAMNAEKLLGVPADQVIKIPTNGDAEGMRAVYAQLGMPEKSEGYEFAQAEGMQADEAFVNWSKDTFHKIGLSNEQAKQLSGAYNEYAQQFLNGAQEDYETAVTAEKQQLQKDWGNGFDAQMTLATEATNKLGFTSEMIDSIEDAVGYAETMKFMANLGTKLGESNFVSPDNGGAGNSGGGNFSGSLTPQQAQQRWTEFTGNAHKMEALTDKQHPQHKAVMEEKATLFAAMHPNNTHQS